MSAKKNPAEAGLNLGDGLNAIPNFRNPVDESIINPLPFLEPLAVISKVIHQCLRYFVDLGSGLRVASVANYPIRHDFRFIGCGSVVPLHVTNVEPIRYSVMCVMPNSMNYRNATTHFVRKVFRLHDFLLKLLKNMRALFFTRTTILTNRFFGFVNVQANIKHLQKRGIDFSTKQKFDVCGTEVFR